MTSEQVWKQVAGLPWMSRTQGNVISRFVREHAIHDILELGFYHGVSTCYMAAAVEESGGGHVVTIDKLSAIQLQPDIHTLLKQLNLSDSVTVHAEPRTYNWRLMKMLEEDPTPRFDLCFIDGSHQWAVDGFAFFLVDRLLKPGGWVIFDDLDWTVASRPKSETAGWADKMTDEEKEIPQIRKVYELLVKTHERYGEFRTEHGWAYAQKQTSAKKSQIRTETVIKTIPVPMEMIRKRLQEKKES